MSGCMCTGVCASGEEAVRCPEWYISVGPALGLDPSGCLVTLDICLSPHPRKSDHMFLLLKLNDSWDGAHGPQGPDYTCPKHLIPPSFTHRAPFQFHKCTELLPTLGPLYTLFSLECSSSS